MSRSYIKSELADLAGVSYPTFNRYLKSRRDVLDSLGSPLHAKTLRGKALEFVCKDYDIDIK